MWLSDKSIRLIVGMNEYAWRPNLYSDKLLLCGLFDACDDILELQLLPHCTIS